MSGFKHAEESQIKESIIANTLRELEIHASLEEEIFYTAAEKEIDQKEMLGEAREQHNFNDSPTGARVGETHARSALGPVSAPSDLGWRT